MSAAVPCMYDNSCAAAALQALHMTRSLHCSWQEDLGQPCLLVPQQPGATAERMLPSCGACSCMFHK